MANQVQSLFYNDVHFNLQLIQECILEIKCETPDGRVSSDQIFKVDTGADGNLMPISACSCKALFPKNVSLNALEQDSGFKGVSFLCLQQYPK